MQRDHPFILPVLKAYVYSRWSTPDQRKGDSARRQLDRAREWARCHRAELVELAADDGLSAFKGKHRGGALGRFLTTIQKGQIERGSTLLVDDLDRLSREDLSKAARLLLDITDAGITVISLRDNQTYRAPLDLTAALFAVTRFSLAHEESEKKRDRGRSAWRAKRAAAVESKKPMTKKGPAWLRWEGDGWTTIPERVAVVRKIFRLFASGMGKHAIAKRLNDENVPHWQGSGWHVSYCDRIRSSRAVLGELALGVRTDDGHRQMTGEVVTDYYPKIITPELWGRVQSNAPKTGGRNPTDRNLFRGIIFSAWDGTPMAMQHHARPKGSTIYLTSLATRLRKARKPHRVRFDRFEANCLHFISAVLPAALASRPQDDSKAETIAAAKAAAEGTDRRLKNLLAVAAAGGRTPSSLIAAIAKAELERDATRSALEIATMRPTNVSAPDAEKAVRHTPEGRRRLRVEIANAIERIELDTAECFSVHVRGWGVLDVDGETFTTPELRKIYQDEA